MMSRKPMVYGALVIGLLLLNAGRVFVNSDRSAVTADIPGAPGLVDAARFELAGLADNGSGVDKIARDLFAPLRLETAPVEAAPKQPAPVAPAARGPSPEELARQRALDELDKFKLAGVVMKDREITAMLISEADHYVVKAGEWIGKDVMIQEITFDDVVLINQEWGVERILTIENLNPIGQD